MGFSNGVSMPLDLEREKAVVAVLEKYCIPKKGRADAATHLGWLAGVFTSNSDIYSDDAEGCKAMRDMLMLSCDPKPQFDGVTAWEIAGKILEAMRPYDVQYARLMTAAPELLNALKWSVKHPGECLGDYPEVLNAAKAIIAKAEGGFASIPLSAFLAAIACGFLLSCAVGVLR